MDQDSAIKNERDIHDDAPMSEPADSASARNQPSLLSGGFGIVVAIVLLATAGYLAYKTVYTVEPTPLDPPPVMYICAETQKTFKHKPKPGETIPILSPFSNKNTGYAAEKCYWTKDGDVWKQKLIPTYVLMNEHIGIKDPTICPDCGRLVTMHNPMPDKGTPIVKKRRSDLADAATPTASAPAED